MAAEQAKKNPAGIFTILPGS